MSADSEHERVISHFATVYAALRLADDYDLLKFPKNAARDALIACLRDHLKVTDGAVNRIVTRSPLALLKAYVRENRAKFVELNDKLLPKGHNYKTCPGYVYEAEGRRRFGFSASLVERFVGGRSAVSALRCELDKLGLIKTVGAGKGSKRFSTKVQVGPKREYLLSLDSCAFD